jgi:membrane protease YdiL (CAAX protease family)
MNNFIGRIFNFVKRERLYVFLLLLVILIQLSFLLLNQFLEASGLGKLFEEKKFEEEIIPAEKIKDAFESHHTLYIIFIFLFTAFIFFAVIGVVFDVIYLYLTQKNKTPIDKTQPLEAVKWDLWDIGKVAIIFLFVQRIIWLADIFLLSAVPFLQARQNLRLMLAATLVDVIAIGAVLYFVLKERQENITSLGLTTRKFFTNIRYGIFAYVGLVPILASVIYITTALFKAFNIPIEPQPVLVILREENHIPSLIYMGFFTSLVGPFLEEIFFRGFAYGVFKKSLGIFWGIVTSALFFAYIHANLASFFPIFCLGVLLTYLYEKTGSLIPSITVHTIHNSLSLFLLLFIKVITG